MIVIDVFTHSTYFTQVSHFKPLESLIKKPLKIRTSLSTNFLINPHPYQTLSDDIKVGSGPDGMTDKSRKFVVAVQNFRQETAKKDE